MELAETLIHPACGDQRSVVAAFDHTTSIEHEDLVRALHGRDPMCDYEYGTSLK